MIERPVLEHQHDDVLQRRHRHGFHLKRTSRRNVSVALERGRAIVCRVAVASYSAGSGDDHRRPNMHAVQQRISVEQYGELAAREIMPETVRNQRDQPTDVHRRAVLDDIEVHREERRAVGGGSEAADDDVGDLVRRQRLEQAGEVDHPALAGREFRTASAKRNAATIRSTRSAGVSRRFSRSSVRSIPAL